MELVQETVEVNEHVRPLNEEVVNASTHLLALMCSLAGAALLISASSQASVGQTIANLVFMASVVVTFCISFFSHAVQEPKAKHLLKIWDQGVIYFMIAGTYTPYTWKYAPPHLLWPLLGFVWGVALFGFLSKVTWQHRVDNRFSAGTYLLLGWIPGLTLISYVPYDNMFWLAAGGISYTIGVVFLKNDRKRFYFHGVWHVCVILGCACQFYPVWLFTSGG